MNSQSVTVISRHSLINKYIRGAKSWNTHSKHNSEINATPIDPLPPTSQQTNEAHLSPPTLPPIHHRPYPPHPSPPPLRPHFSFLISPSPLSPFPPPSFNPRFPSHPPSLPPIPPSHPSLPTSTTPPNTTIASSQEPYIPPIPRHLNSKKPLPTESCISPISIRADSRSEVEIP